MYSINDNTQLAGKRVKPNWNVEIPKFEDIITKIEQMSREILKLAQIMEMSEICQSNFWRVNYILISDELCTCELSRGRFSFKLLLKWQGNGENRSNGTPNR